MRICIIELCDLHLIDLHHPHLHKYRIVFVFKSFSILVDGWTQYSHLYLAGEINWVVQMTLSVRLICLLGLLSHRSTTILLFRKGIDSLRGPRGARRVE